MSEFLSEIIELTKKSMDSSAYYYGGSQPQLPDIEVKLYGREAGVDYANTVFGKLKEIIKEEARTSKNMKISFRIPSGGKAAIKGAEETFSTLLDGFDVEVRGSSMSIDWKKHFNMK